MSSDNPEQVHPDLTLARAKANFNIEDLTHWLDGGIERTSQRRHFLRVLESDPLFCVDDDIFKDRISRYRLALARARRLKELQMEMTIEDDASAIYLLKLVAAFDDPTTLHELMFVPNIEALCTTQQRAVWLPLCRDWRVIGCYAQTEIGHGSNVRGIETTATYINETEEFELNTPSPSASKFWPGSLGRTANTAMVIARLITNGTDHGNHNFLVPIRDQVTHEPLPGVTVGDIGPKLGFNNMDNGFLQLKGVRIPRGNMAARFAHVDPATGVYVPTADATTRRLTGLTMTQVRAHIIQSSGRALAQACTVAVRYSTVRRQGFTESDADGATEHAVLEYATQRHRLFPLLASAFCFHVGGLAMAGMMGRTEALVKSEGSSVPATLLAEVHALSSGLKALCTGVAADGIETCRRACGGHGYLLASGLPTLLATFLQTVTVEGDNYLLPQQTARFLLKAFETATRERKEKNAASPSSVPESCAYLVPFLAHPHARCPASSLQDFLLCSTHGGSPAAEGREGVGSEEAPAAALRLLVGAFEHRAGRLVADLAALLQQKVTREGLSVHEAWISSLVEVGKATAAHCQAYLFRTFASFVSGGDSSSLLGGAGGFALDEACMAALRRLCLLYGLHGMDAELGDWLEDGFLSSEQAGWVRAALREVLNGAVADDSVALCDAWDFADRQLQSTLGRKDGQVYQAVLEMAQRSPLNTELKTEDFKALLRPLKTTDEGQANPRARL